MGGDNAERTGQSSFPGIRTALLARVRSSVSAVIVSVPRVRVEAGLEAGGWISDAAGSVAAGLADLE